MGLYPDTLASATTGADGTLWLKFESGAILEVPSNPQYEAWQVNGPDNYLDSLDGLENR